MKKNLCYFFLLFFFNFSHRLLANSYFSNTQRVKAIKAYKENRWNEAMQLICSAIEENANDSRNYYWRSKIRIDTIGKNKDLHKALHLNPSFFEALVARGNLFFSLKKNASALKDYNKALELRPAFEAFLGKGLILQFQKKWKKAASYFSLALDMNTSDLLSLEHRSFCLMKIKDNKKAINDCVTYIQKNQNNKKIWSLLASLYFKEKKYEKALLCWERLENKYSHNTFIQHNIGICLFHLELYDRSEKVFRDMISLNRKNAHAYNQLGNIFLKKNLIDSAIQSYSQAIRLNPSQKEFYYNRGLSYKKKKFFDSALKNFKIVLQKDPYFLKLNFFLGQIYYEEKKWKKAIKYFEKTIVTEQSQEQMLRINIFLAHSWNFLKNYKKAISVWTEILILNPQLEEAYFQRALCYTKINREEAAIKNYKMVLSLNPKNAETYYNLGNIFCRKKQFKKAISFFDKARTLSPLWRDVSYNRAVANKALGHISNANKDLDRSLF